jgi:aspartate kinase
MKVMKFGGTSVGKPERMKYIAKLIQSHTPVLVVLSALSGTTNTLVEIGNCLRKQDQANARRITNELHEHYKQFIKELYDTDQLRHEANATIKEHFDLVHFIIDRIKDFTQVEDKLLLAQGELMSTKMFYLYLHDQGVNSALLPALDFMRIDDDNEPDLPYIEAHLRSIISSTGEKKLFITQGYICRNPKGEVDNLKRGGSDYTASLVGAALRCDVIEIWTDIDGMHNNDPRIVNRTRPVRELSFEEAAELAYFGAKILHPTCIWPAQKYHIPVKLLNTMQPEAQGTIITNAVSAEESKSIKAIAAKDGITAIKIRSSRMLLAYGFMSEVFDIFERYKTSVDMIVTSEVAISLTIDDTTHLEHIIEDLEKIGTVQIDENYTIICVVGNFKHVNKDVKKDVMKKIFNALEGIPIRMISYGGSDYNISLLVAADYKKQTLTALNEGLFEWE